MAAALFPGTPQGDGSRVPGYLWNSQVIIREGWSGYDPSTGLVKTAGFPVGSHIGLNVCSIHKLEHK